MSKPRLIAFYLPQYYPTKENDEWWGKGFTEWTNVGRAKPLFKGHYQPRVPADLGYYDLRVPEVRIQQAEMAKNAGIEGFCYWHYWFAGKRMLDRVFGEVVETGKPDFPFCLCWANHSWYAKTWDPNKPSKLLIEQTYPGIEDYEEHFYAMLPAFKDRRYIRINEKILFAVYDPLNIPEPQLFIETWNRLARENGLEGFYFMGFTIKDSLKQEILKVGFDSVLVDFVFGASEKSGTLPNIYIKKILRKLLRKPITIEYSQYSQYLLNNYIVNENVYPSICPNYDHSPRSKFRGTIIGNSTPQKWKKLCHEMFSKVSVRSAEDNLVFIKAWNEWGEGNYLEPDLKYGTQFLDVIRDVLEKVK